MKTFFIALRTAAFTAAFLWFWIWLALGVRRYDHQFGFALPAWSLIVGIELAATGGALALACVGWFVVRGRGTPAPFDAPRLFVATGPYKRVRNPMYIGGALLLAGIGFAERSVSMLLFTAGWLVLAHLFVVLYEEPALRRKFGASYEDYCRATPRWLPKRGSAPS
jgi:protein-S-isoprenylcysteine O-methyltransferase Ste14